MSKVKKAADLIFSPDLPPYKENGMYPTARGVALEFINYMENSRNLTRPGFYVGTRSSFVQTLVASPTATVTESQ